jgi:hypothetical protein
MSHATGGPADVHTVACLQVRQVLIAAVMNGERCQVGVIFLVESDSCIVRGYCSAKDAQSLARLDGPSVC